MNYWLMKSEPSAFSIDDLAACQREPWSGVRNYQARNFMKSMCVGDRAFFYHSNCKIPGIVGMMEVLCPAYPDATQFDPDSPYFDPKGTFEKPRWFNVDVGFVERFHSIIALSFMRVLPEMQESPLLRHRNRLSIIPLQTHEWQCLLAIARQK